MFARHCFTCTNKQMNYIVRPPYFSYMSVNKLHFHSAKSLTCKCLYTRYHMQLLKPWRNFPLWAQTTSHPSFYFLCGVAHCKPYFLWKAHKLSRKTFSALIFLFLKWTFLFSPSHTAISLLFIWLSDTGKNSSGELGTKSQHHASSTGLRGERNPLCCYKWLCAARPQPHTPQLHKLVWTRGERAPSNRHHTHTVYVHTQNIPVVIDIWHRRDRCVFPQIRERVGKKRLSASNTFAARRLNEWLTQVYKLCFPMHRLVKCRNLSTVSKLTLETDRPCSTARRNAHVLSVPT